MLEQFENRVCVFHVHERSHAIAFAESLRYNPETGEVLAVMKHCMPLEIDEVAYAIAKGVPPRIQEEAKNADAAGSYTFSPVGGISRCNSRSEIEWLDLFEKLVKQVGSC